MATKVENILGNQLRTYFISDRVSLKLFHKWQGWLSLSLQTLSPLYTFEKKFELCKFELCTPPPWHYDKSFVTIGLYPKVNHIELVLSSLTCTKKPIKSIRSELFALQDILKSIYQMSQNCKNCLSKCNHIDKWYHFECDNLEWFYFEEKNFKISSGPRLIWQWFITAKLQSFYNWKK